MLERFTQPARHVVAGAQQEARDFGHRWIGSEHLLLALLREPGEPGAATLLRLGVTPESCGAAIASVVSTEDAPLGPEDAEALKAFGIDLDEVRRRAEGAFGDGALDARPLDPAARGERKARRGLFGRRRGRGPGQGAADRTGPGTGTGPASVRIGSGTGLLSGHIPFTGRAKKTLELALREAVARKDRHIGVEHLVLGLLRGDDKVSRALFERLGIAPGEVRDLVLADLRRAA